MTFDDVLTQVLALLKRQGRVSYSALKRRFDLDDDYLNDLKDELLYAHLDVHFISSLPVMQQSAYTSWVDRKPVQSVVAEG